MAVTKRRVTWQHMEQADKRCGGQLAAKGTNTGVGVGPYSSRKMPGAQSCHGPASVAGLARLSALRTASCLGPGTALPGPGRLLGSLCSVLGSGPSLLA